jgi:hypothetical protein
MPLGTGNAVFHYSANFFNRMVFVRAMARLLLRRSLR